MTDTTTLLVKDLNGNTLGKFEVDVEASRIEGLSIRLSDDAETLVVELTLEEV